MNKPHPIIAPSRNLVREWAAEASPYDIPADHIAAKAAQWGWEQRGAVNEAELQKARNEELEACCQFLNSTEYFKLECDLFNARRPKLPTPKERALEVLDRVSKDQYPCNYQADEDWETIRQALELLPDEEV